MKVLFAIPLKSPQDEQEKDRIDILLSLTLDSLAQQTNMSYMAAVCGHVRPVFSLARHPETMWLKAPFPPPAEAEDFREDKIMKRAHIVSRMKDLAPFYYMALDGDDLVDRKCVDYVLQMGHNRGVYFQWGYALDFLAGCMAPVPGVWRRKYHKVCGSSSIIYMEPGDLPDSFSDPVPRLFWDVRSHLSVVKNMAKVNRKLLPFPVRGGVYVLNNGVNLSYRVIKEKRKDISERIQEHAVNNPLDIISRFVSPDFYLKALKHPCFKQ